MKNEDQNIGGYLQALLLIWCVSSPPVHLLSPVWPKPGWPISTWDRPHLQDGQGKVREHLYVFYSKMGLLYVVRKTFLDNLFHSVRLVNKYM